LRLIQAVLAIKSADYNASLLICNRESNNLSRERLRADAV
jgi:hypothetical protein